MTVNTEDPLAYELLAMAIDEFEKTAINSGTREGFLAVANGPLTGMETVLDGSERVLTNVNDTRKTVQAADEGVAGTDGETRKKTPNEIFAETNIEWDADLQDLFGGEDNPTANYLSECLGCNLMVSQRAHH